MANLITKIKSLFKKKEEQKVEVSRNDVSIDDEGTVTVQGKTKLPGLEYKMVLSDIEKTPVFILNSKVRENMVYHVFVETYKEGDMSWQEQIKTQQYGEICVIYLEDKTPCAMFMYKLNGWEKL